MDSNVMKRFESKAFGEIRTGGATNDASKEIVWYA
jgi:hypothetical protein